MNLLECSYFDMLDLVKSYSGAFQVFSLATWSYSFITMSSKYVVNGELSFAKSYGLAKWLDGLSLK